MSDVSIAEAKAMLSDLVRAAEEGRSTIITRRGRPVARIEPLDGDASWHRPARTFDFDRLHRHLDSMPMGKTTGADVVRTMRDAED
ncbi:MAG: type II toxin-antitoxin system prevent-host-death family antitoxin [Hyphomicrobiales bacterium]|nr:type II toxin-antitoxin system prevent-host-death family antitoxin [Hyphomicrobiales bacterium]